MAKVKNISNFDSYLKLLTLDVSKFNDDNNIEYSNVQLIQFELNTLYNFMNYDFDLLEDFYEDYTLDDNDRPDLLAKRLYEDENLWWVILVINKISYYDLPLTDEKLYELATYLFETEYKYSSIAIYYEVLKEINEAKRKIKIIQPQNLYLILRQIYEQLRG